MLKRGNAVLLASIVISTTLIGCGSGQGRSLKLVPVKGTVKLDGKPVGGVSLIFNPLNSTRGTGAYAVTAEDGSYQLTHMSQKPGVEEGTYGITFSKVTQPDGSPIPPGKTRSTVATVEQMPKIYTKFDSTRVAEGAIVKPETSTLDFDLDSKKKLKTGGAGRPGPPQ